MDGTMWIAIVIVGFITLMMVLVAIKSKSVATKRKLEMLDTFNRIVADEKLFISQKEILNNKILAIDETQKIAVFVVNHGEVKYDIIQLEMISDCKIKSMGSKLTEKKKNGRTMSEEYVNEIYLSLIAANKSVKDVPIYNEVQDGVLEKMTLIDVADKWRSIISANLDKR